MTTRIKLSVVVPLYNEEDNVFPLCEALAPVLIATGHDFEIILVDDGSKDQTAARLRDVARPDTHIKVVLFRRNFGQTAAMMAGFDHATGDIVIPMDGDLQNDPKDIPMLLAKLDEGFDVCSGWRKDRKDNAIKRNLPSRVANKLISTISGVHLNDYGCSLKAYRRDVIKDVKLYGEMHRFIPIYASWQGARVTEIPVAHHPRIHGTSKYGLERVVKVVLDLIVVKFLAKYAQKPIYVFGGFGLLSLFCSFIFLVWALILKVVLGTSFSRTPLITLFALTASIGVLCFLMGLMAELIMRTYFESQNKAIYQVREKLNF